MAQDGRNSIVKPMLAVIAIIVVAVIGLSMWGERSATSTTPGEPARLAEPTPQKPPPPPQGAHKPLAPVDELAPGAR